MAASEKAKRTPLSVSVEAAGALTGVEGAILSLPRTDDVPGAAAVCCVVVEGLVELVLLPWFSKEDQRLCVSEFWGRVNIRTFHIIWTPRLEAKLRVGPIRQMQTNR